ncbi:MAG: transcription termination/antitermination NusG family protein [Ferruginibacter sp.]
MPNLWYVVSTVKGKESKARAHCEKHGITCYLPMTGKKGSASAKPGSQQKELIFPSMMFIYMNAGQVDVLKACSVIKNFMYFLDKPATISEQEIESLRAFLEKHTELELERIPVKIMNNEEHTGVVQFITVTKTSSFLLLPSIGYKLVTPNRTQYSLVNTSAIQERTNAANR